MRVFLFQGVVLSFVLGSFAGHASLVVTDEASLDASTEVLFEPVQETGRRRVRVLHERMLRWMRQRDAENNPVSLEALGASLGRVTATHEVETLRGAREAQQQLPSTQDVLGPLRKISIGDRAPMPLFWRTFYRITGLKTATSRADFRVEDPLHQVWVTASAFLFAFYPALFSYYALLYEAPPEMTKHMFAGFFAAEISGIYFVATTPSGIATREFFRGFSTGFLSRYESLEGAASPEMKSKLEPAHIERTLQEGACALALS